jgi:hypothetical protein
VRLRPSTRRQWRSSISRGNKPVVGDRKKTGAAGAELCADRIAPSSTSSSSTNNSACRSGDSGSRWRSTSTGGWSGVGFFGAKPHGRLRCSFDSHNRSRRSKHFHRKHHAVRDRGAITRDDERIAKIAPTTADVPRSHQTSGRRVALPSWPFGTHDAFNVIQSDPQLADRFQPAVLHRWTTREDYLRLLASFEIALLLEHPFRAHRARFGTPESLGGDNRRDLSDPAQPDGTLTGVPNVSPSPPSAVTISYRTMSVFIEEPGRFRRSPSTVQ